MALREVRVSGRDYLALATELLQRARVAGERAGFWEAADFQWWWRMPRSSDDLDQLFWLDAEGPVAGAFLLDWDRRWECNPVLVPGTAVEVAEVWKRAVELIDSLGLRTVEVFARDDEGELLELLSGSGFVPDDARSWVTWMDSRDRPEVAPLRAGFAIVDRGAAVGKPHPMRLRNGSEVEARLGECSLYDPSLDLAVETTDGEVAGYALLWFDPVTRVGLGECSLYDPSLDLAVETTDGEVAGYALLWFDPVTRVGLVEPMRVEDAYQRRGLGRALLTEGLERLAARGAERLKVGFGTEPARGLYLGAGFRVAATGRSYRSVRAPEPRPADAASD